MKRGCLIVFLLCVGLIFGKDNVYTFDGDYTYHDILRAMGLKTGRSVLGASIGLELRRNFDICNKPYGVAVDEVRKNLRTDGFLLYDDTACFYVVKLDSTQKNKGSDSAYAVYEPYSKMWLITGSKEAFLNAKEIDKEKHLKDSASRVDSVEREGKRRAIYRCDLYIIGSTGSDSSDKGVYVGSPLSVVANVASLKGIAVSEVVAGGWDMVRDSLNFRRHLIFYIHGDSSSNLMFGDETRRTNSEITSATGAVSTSYESVYNGLSLDVSHKIYSLTYRLDDNQIKLIGVPDSVVMGSSSFVQDQVSRTWGIFRYHQEQRVLFYFAAVMKVDKVSKD